MGEELYKLINLSGHVGTYIDLVDGFARYIGADEGLSLDVARAFALKHRQH